MNVGRDLWLFLFSTFPNKIIKKDSLLTFLYLLTRVLSTVLGTLVNKHEKVSKEIFSMILLRNQTK